MESSPSESVTRGPMAADRACTEHGQHRRRLLARGGDALWCRPGGLAIVRWLSRWPGWIAGMLVALCVAPAWAGPSSIADSTQVTVRVGIGDVSVSREHLHALRDEDGGFQSQLYLLELFFGPGGLDLFGLAAYRYQGMFDPYLAAIVRIENLSDQPQFVTANLNALVEPLLANQDGWIERFLQVDVIDADGDGSATYGSAFYTFMLDNATSGLGLGRGGAFSAAQGSTTLLAGTEPAWSFRVPPVVGQLDRLGLSMTGMLSPGDALAIEFFSCLRSAGQVCPDRPSLRAGSVPLPSSAALLALALALMWLRSAGRPSAAAVPARRCAPRPAA